jgi:hypothetical protein
VRAVASLWPKVVAFTLESVGVQFAEPRPEAGWGDQPLVFVESGQVLGNLTQVAMRVYSDRFPELVEQMGLAKIKEDVVKSFTLRIGPVEGTELQLGVNGLLRTLYLSNADGRGYALHSVIATGMGQITVSRVPLKEARLGEVNLTFGYGEGKVGDRDALLVRTEKDDGGGALTIRFRPSEPPHDLA